MPILPAALRPHYDLLGLSFLSRLPLSMAGVGLLTLGLQRGLGAGLSGTATATYALCFGLAGPFLGRAATSGIPRVLTLCLIGQLVACMLLLVSKAPAPYLVSAVLLGLTTPPLAAIMRATWNRLFADDPGTADRMAVVETMNTETVHITGRLVVAGLAVVGGWLIPWTYAAVMATGVLRLRHDPRLTAPVRRQRTSGRRWELVNRTTVVWGLVLAMMAISHGAAATAMVAGIAPSGSWRGAALMSVWGIGSLIGGAASLSRPSLASPIRTAALGLVWFSLSAVALSCAIGGTAAAVLLVLALGMPISPTMGAVYRGAGPATPKDRQVELFASYTSTVFVGFSMGSAAAGWVTELATSTGSAFLLAGLASIAALTGLAFVPRDVRSTQLAAQSGG